MKNILLCLIFISSSSLANDQFSMSFEEFYQVKDNQEMYNKLLNNGYIEKSKKMFKSQCLEAAKDKKSEDEIAKCDCAAKVVEKSDGKLLMYNSVLAYKSFQAKVEARKSGNMEEYERLKKLDSKRQGVTQLFKNVCE